MFDISQGNKKQQEEIGKMSEGVKLMRSFEHDKVDPGNLWAYTSPCIFLKIAIHVCQPESQQLSLCERSQSRHAVSMVTCGCHSIMSW